MLKTTLTTLAIIGLALPAQAQTVKILSVFDDAAPTTECDAHFGTQDGARHCYVMPDGNPRDTPTNWGLAHNNPNFHLTITGPAVVVATYDQDAFANTPFAIAQHGLPTSAGFRIGIGVNSTTVPCSGGFSPSYAADTETAENSATLTAKCAGLIPAGQTVTFYPITAQRDGIAYFSGPGESVLTIMVFPQ